MPFSVCPLSIFNVYIPLVNPKPIPVLVHGECTFRSYLLKSPGTNVTSSLTPTVFIALGFIAFLIIFNYLGVFDRVRRRRRDKKIEEEGTKRYEQDMSEAVASMKKRMASHFQIPHPNPYPPKLPQPPPSSSNPYSPHVPYQPFPPNARIRYPDSAKTRHSQTLPTIFDGITSKGAHNPSGPNANIQAFFDSPSYVVPGRVPPPPNSPVSVSPISPTSILTNSSGGSNTAGIGGPNGPAGGPQSPQQKPRFMIPKQIGAREENRSIMNPRFSIREAEIKNAVPTFSR